MGKIFNIAGPCNPDRHYMLPASARLPEVMRLVDDQAYFVVHAPRQCGKTTSFQALADEINAKGERVALYCSVEEAQGKVNPAEGLPSVVDQLRAAVEADPGLFANVTKRELCEAVADSDSASQVKATLKVLAERCAPRQLVVFFDEVDCLSEGTLIGFLRQLRNGRITYKRPGTFPTSIALIGMRNIRDYKARVRPDAETLGSASPFNVITKAMTLRLFTLEEVKALYAQHTAATGQVFEAGVAEQAFAYTCGQPYLVNALARWCMDEIHDRRYAEPITLADVHEAKEKVIRERGTHLDSIMERMKEPRVRRVVEPVMLGTGVRSDLMDEDVSFALDLGLLKESAGDLVPANPMYAEIIGRYLSRTAQEDVKMLVKETPWVLDGGLDMAGLMAAFQQFWRENAGANRAPFEYNEAYPHIVLQAFLQRVLNGGGEIVREMSLGRGALDLGVRFRGATYAVEVKLLYSFRKNPEKAYAQMVRYIDHLGQSEGWLVVFDPDLAKPWDEKIGLDEVERDGRRIHIVRC